MTALRTLLAALLVATGLVLLVPAAAFACSCATSGAADHVARADVVVIGEVTRITPPPERELMSSVDPATYAVAVERVLSGRAGATIDVRSPVSGASCGLEGIEVGREYVVFAARHDIEGDPTRALWANLCGGTGPASRSYVAEVAAVTGGGAPPEQDVPAWARDGALAAGVVAAAAAVVAAGLAVLRAWEQAPSGE